MVVQPTTVRDVLRRMQRAAKTRVDFALAREIATREGIKAVIDGSLLGVGGRYVIAMRLVSAQIGRRARDVPRDGGQPVGAAADAVDRLAKEVRAKIGESLKNVQSAPPLEQVTTSSLEALKKYVQGVKLIDVDGDFARGTALLEEAVALDTGFAMAYRKLGVEYGNRGLAEKARRLLREGVRAPGSAERRRAATSCSAATTATARIRMTRKALAAYEQLLEIQPNNTAGLNNLGVGSCTGARRREPSRCWRARSTSVPWRGCTIEISRGADVAGEDRFRAGHARMPRSRFRRNIDCPAVRYQTPVRGRGTIRLRGDASGRVRAAVPGAEVRSTLTVGFEADLARLHGKIADAMRFMTESDAPHGAGWRQRRALDERAGRGAGRWRGSSATPPARVQLLDDSLARHPIQTWAGLAPPGARS